MLNNFRVMCQVSAAVVLIAAVALAALQFIGAIQIAEPAPGEIIGRVAPGVAYLLFGAAGALILLVLSNHDNRESTTDLIDAVDDLRDRVNDLDRNIRQHQAEMDKLARGPAQHPALSNGENAPAPVSAPTQDNDDIARILTMLEEVREASLLNDEQKQQKLDRIRQQKRRQQLRNFDRLLDDEAFAEAQELLEAMEAEFGEDDMRHARSKLVEAREQSAEANVDNVRARIEDLMSISSWDEAYQLARELAGNFPEHEVAQATLKRVQHERDLFREDTVQRLYDEVKYESERRQWRRALTAGQKLIDRFGEHKRADRVRKMRPTLQENAEIEERQDVEQRIADLIKGRRYAEAIELGEDLMERFPNSPQAQRLEEMLPRLREKAMAQEIDSFA